MIDTFDTQETDALLEGTVETTRISENALSGAAKDSVIKILKPSAEPVKQHERVESPQDTDVERATQVKAELASAAENGEDTSDVAKDIQKFHREQLGKAITIKQDGKVVVVGYVLPISEKKHFVMLDNKRMFVVEPELSEKEYKRVMTPDGSSIELGEWATSTDKAQEYITNGTIFKVTLTNDREETMPELIQQMTQAVHTAREQKEERNHAHQESARELTALANAIPETSNSDESLTQPAANDGEELKTKEAKSRLAKIAAKLKDGVKNYYIPDIERLIDRQYTQEELFDLVKRAEAELLKEKMEKQKEKNLASAAVAEEAGPINIEALAATATELTKDIEANELSFSEMIDKEKKGDKINKAELLSLWKDRGRLMDSLNEIQEQQYAYTSQLSEQAAKSLVQKLFQPVNKFIWKMWDSLNKKNPMHEALPKLSSAAYAKTRKTHQGEWGLKEERQYRKWRKDASPSELALVISEKQMAKADFDLAA